MSKAIQERADFNIIRYANCWEDSEILVNSLNLSAEKSCLSIASAGDNSLSLLVSNPKLVVAVDLSEVQLACVEIRKIAIAELDYKTLLCFLGLEPSDERLNTYQKKIRKRLSSDAKSFWDQHNQFISDGIIYHGKFEHYFSLFRRYALPFVHSRKLIKQLLAEKSLIEQKTFYDKKWNTWRWRLMFKFFFSRYFMGKAGRDAEFFKYVEENVAKNIFSRAQYALTELPTSSNSYLNFIMTGSYNNALPFYLKEENVNIIRENIDSLELFKGTVDQAIDHYGIKFDAFNLSDIFEYMDEKMFKKVSANILSHTKAGARLAYWNMLVPRSVAQIFPEKTRHLKLSHELFLQDRAFFYKSFEVDEVLE